MCAVPPGVPGGIASLAASTSRAAFERSAASRSRPRGIDMVGSSRRPGFLSRLGRWHVAGLSLAAAVVVALVVALLAGGTTHTATPQGNDLTAKPGPGRSLQGGGNDVDTPVGATKVDPAAEPD